MQTMDLCFIQHLPNHGISNFPSISHLSQYHHPTHREILVVTWLEVTIAPHDPTQSLSPLLKHPRTDPWLHQAVDVDVVTEKHSEHEDSPMARPATTTDVTTTQHSRQQLTSSTTNQTDDHSQANAHTQSATGSFHSIGHASSCGHVWKLITWLTRRMYSRMPIGTTAKHPKRLKQKTRIGQSWREEGISNRSNIPRPSDVCVVGVGYRSELALVLQL